MTTAKNVFLAFAILYDGNGREARAIDLAIIADDEAAARTSAADFIAQRDLTATDWRVSLFSNGEELPLMFEFEPVNGVSWLNPPHDDNPYNGPGLYGIDINDVHPAVRAWGDIVHWQEQDPKPEAELFGIVRSYLEAMPRDEVYHVVGEEHPLWHTVNNALDDVDRYAFVHRDRVRPIMIGGEVSIATTPLRANLRVTTYDGYMVTYTSYVISDTDWQQLPL